MKNIFNKIYLEQSLTFSNKLANKIKKTQNSMKNMKNYSKFDKLIREQEKCHEARTLEEDKCRKFLQLP